MLVIKKIATKLYFLMMGIKLPEVITAEFTIENKCRLNVYLDGKLIEEVFEAKTGSNGYIIHANSPPRLNSTGSGILYHKKQGNVSVTLA